MSNINNSPLKMFYLIEILLKNPSTYREMLNLMEKFNIRLSEKTVAKYLRTLKKAGFDIQYKDKMYQICKTPFNVDFTKKETEGFYTALNILKKLFYNKTELVEYKIVNFGKMTHDYTYDMLEPFTNKNRADILEKLAEYLLYGPIKLSIAYRSKRYVLVAQDLKFNKNGIFLSGYDVYRKNTKILKIDYIKSMCFLNQADKFYFKETIFKITGRLVKNYAVRIGERAAYFDNYIIVYNSSEEKGELFKRLLKYGIYCEIIGPAEDRKKFIRKTKALLRYYKSM